jgi:CubicO group peptidase (beta-lactamase class C family)
MLLSRAACRWLLGPVLTLSLLAPAAWAQDRFGCGMPRILADGWQTAAPEQVGMDGNILCGIGPRFEAAPEVNAHAVVVARQGKIVYEHYFTGSDEIWGHPVGVVGFDAGTRHDLRSVTKSVTSLLVGIAIDQGWIKDIDAPIAPYLPEFAELRTLDKQHITVRQLLTMSSGIAWDESLPYSNPANSERPMDDATDPYLYVVQQPMAAEPGKTYNYCGCSAVLLEAILQKTSHQPLDLIAKNFLFDPLGITDVEWSRFPNGDVLAHGGLRLRARDMLKIGQLVLNHGTWNGRRIVSQSWIDQSISPQINGEGIFFYGYQWWLGRSLLAKRQVDWAAGFGWGGQRLYIVPSKEMTIAVFSGAYGKPQVVGNTVLNDYVFASMANPKPPQN